MGLEVWTIDKNFFKRNKNYRFLYSLLVSKFGVEQANAIFDAANIELKKVTMEYPDIPKGERRHTNLFIFPRVAIYRVMKQHFGKDAIDLMDEVICFEGEKMGGILKRITSFPFMERLFLLLFSVMAKNMFGEKNGFQQRFYPSPRGTVKFDILDCVYCRYCRKCGCPELIHTFCNTDAYCFGNLSKIRFVREDTLENGEKCDFTLRIKFWNRIFLYLAERFSMWKPLGFFAPYRQLHQNYSSTPPQLHLCRVP